MWTRLIFLSALVVAVWTGKQSVQPTSVRLISTLPFYSNSRLLMGPSLISASKAMTTVVTYLTTVPTCSFTTSCAVTQGAVTACRRLRRDFDIDALLPSKPLRVETTVAPTADEGTFMPELVSSSEPRDVVVNGLLADGNCGREAGAFGVTIIYTRTVVSEVTCQSSVTHTNTFTLAGCTPAGLLFCPSD